MRTFLSFLWRFILIFVTLGGMLWLMMGCDSANDAFTDWLVPDAKPKPTATP